METEYTGKLIKIFIEGSDKYGHELLYKSIIEVLEKCEVSGATVIRGIEGFGEEKKIHEDFLEVLSRNLPIVIEVAVKNEKVDEVIEKLSKMITSGKIVIVDNVNMISFE
ncbi:DUF190 domain-containing protein [Clostridium thermobutyricum]